MTDTAVDTVPASADNAPMVTHLVCGTCWPEAIPMGTPAICGVRLLGVPAKRKATCADCEEGKHRHALRHAMGF